jgi:hypothetical protein
MTTSGDTVARGNGTNLSAFFSTDYSGNARPSTGPWTIGAYEYGARPIYYISPTGNDANDGLTTLTPKTMGITYTLGPSNTIIALPGTYLTNIIIRQNYTVFQSLAKWGARIAPPTGNGLPGISVYPSGTHHVTIDGFDITNAPMNGVTLYGSNCVVRNCWIHGSGAAHGGNGNGAGIFSYAPYYNTLIEGNLCESNGYASGYDHGIYVSGTNVVIRNNILRYNLGFGVSMYDHNGGGDINGCLIYNNLMYGNVGNSSGEALQLGISCTDVGTTNAAFGNTLIGTSSHVVYAYNTTLLVTNNILISTGTGTEPYNPSSTVSWIKGDYNMAPQTLNTAGAHDVINAYSGLDASYYLKSDSPARGHALAAVCGPVDFFGIAQSSVSDIGAFQFIASPPPSGSTIGSVIFGNVSGGGFHL